MKKLIAFEGIDGSGKSTQIKLLSQKIEALGEEVFLTCEPTNQYIGKIIRDIFSYKYQASQETIAGLFVADRLEHILHPTQGMLAELNTKYVLTDRYYFSSYAYHGVHVDMQWVIESNKMAVYKAKADVHFFIDVDPEKCVERILNTRKNIEMYETLDNLVKVRRQYLKAFDQLKSEENVVFIDGNQSIEVIAEDVWKNFQKII
ncbi:MAG: dTMP kinase [Saprospiraceae bacterium]